MLDAIKHATGAGLPCRAGNGVSATRALDEKIGAFYAREILIQLIFGLRAIRMAATGVGSSPVLFGDTVSILLAIAMD